jgi:hypothetical protein
MSSSGSDELTEFVDEPASSSHAKPSPDQYVLRWPWYYAALFGGCALLFGGLYAMAGSIAGLLTLSLVGTLIGLVLTMIAMAWAVAIVFADDTRSGLWFVLFPPYMPFYAVRRWRWMAQPSVMFLCGLTLAAASLIATEWLAKSIEVRPSSAMPESGI